MLKKHMTPGTFAVVGFLGLFALMALFIAPDQASYQVQAQTMKPAAFKWPEPVGWMGYGGGVYVYEADIETNPFEPVLAAFIVNHPQVRVVSVLAEGFSKKYENPQRTRRYVVICEPVK